MKYIKRFLLFFVLLSCYSSYAQKTNTYPGFYDEINSKIAGDSTSRIYVSAINITGNKKTKNYIILREVVVKKGDSVVAARLQSILEESRNLLYNTTLFTEVDIQPVLTSAYTLVLNVMVKERWYIFPTPQFKLIDRNFNEWIKVYNADFNRVVYGVKFAHYNFSGRGDQLRIYLLNGYARNYSFSYTAPYSNKALTEGFSFAAGYTQNREFPYKTSYNNGLLQFKKNDFERNTLVIAGAYRLRRGYFKRHLFSVQYTNVNINDSVITAKYNPNYFNVAKAAIGFVDFTYAFQDSNTDNVNYPLKGKIISLGATKRGFGFTGGINALTLDASYRRFFTHTKQYYSAVEVISKVKLPFRQAYINQKALGYADLYLRGLENYVVDGVAAAVAKYTFSKKLVSFKIPVPFKIKKTTYYIPFSFYGKTFVDGGFSYNRDEFDTRLNNRFLYSGGVGLDILTLYDFNIRIEYSFNQLGEKGLFLHTRTNM